MRFEGVPKPNNYNEDPDLDLDLEREVGEIEKTSEAFVDEIKKLKEAEKLEGKSIHLRDLNPEDLTPMAEDMWRLYTSGKLTKTAFLDYRERFPYGGADHDLLAYIGNKWHSEKDPDFSLERREEDSHVSLEEFRIHIAEREFADKREEREVFPKDLNVEMLTTEDQRLWQDFMNGNLDDKKIEEAIANRSSYKDRYEFVLFIKDLIDVRREALRGAIKKARE